MESRIEKIKSHIKENKEVYISVGVGVLLAGITVLIVRGRHAGVLRVPDGSDVITVRPLSFNFGGKNNGSPVIVIHNGNVGHPGFITKCLETGEIFQSQKSAAKTLGISPSILSSHLNGQIDNADGLHFERFLA